MGGKIHRKLFGECHTLTKVQQLENVRDSIDEKEKEIEDTKEKLLSNLYKINLKHFA
jgi:hypothetical protein